MTTRFGQTLFGGITGIVTAAGIAVCTAQASGHHNTFRYFEGSATATAQAVGKGYRTTKTLPKPLVCSAVGFGEASATLKVSGLAQGIASASGHEFVDFFGAGTAIAKLTVTELAVRLARVRLLPAKASASLVGEGFVHQIGEPAPAKAFAHGFGTTYHVGYGQAQAAAVLAGTAYKQVGVFGDAQASAGFLGTGAFTIGGAGHAIGYSHFLGDAAVTRQGTRYLTAFGSANADATAELTSIGIHQAQTGWARAYGTATAQFTIGASGHAKAQAIGFGDALSAATAVTALVGGSAATATGQANLLAGGKGTAVAVAMATGDALVRTSKAYGQTAQGICLAQASGEITQTRATPDTAYGFALAQGKCNRTHLAAARPIALAQVLTGYAIKHQVGVGVAVASSQAQGTKTRTQFASGKGQCSASASNAEVWLNVSGQAAECSSHATASATRTRHFNGEALAQASGFGANQINDLLPAPVSRTVYVLVAGREVPVASEVRHFVV